MDKLNTNTLGEAVDNMNGEPKSIEQDLRELKDPKPLKMLVMLIIVVACVLVALTLTQKWHGLNLWGTKEKVEEIVPERVIECKFDETTINIEIITGDTPLVICKGIKCIKTYDGNAQMQISPKESFTEVICTEELKDEPEVVPAEE